MVVSPGSQTRSDHRPNREADMVSFVIGSIWLEGALGDLVGLVLEIEVLFSQGRRAALADGRYPICLSCENNVDEAYLHF